MDLSSPHTPFLGSPPLGDGNRIASFSIPNAFRSLFATTFQLHMLLFQRFPKRFGTEICNFLSPRRRPQSSIVIEMVVIFEVFMVLCSNAVLGPPWQPLGLSWGAIGATLRAQNEMKKATPVPFEGVCFKMRFRPPTAPEVPPTFPEGLQDVPNLSARGPQKVSNEVPQLLLRYYATSYLAGPVRSRVVVVIIPPSL